MSTEPLEGLEETRDIVIMRLSDSDLDILIDVLMENWNMHLCERSRELHDQFTDILIDRKEETGHGTG